MRLGLFFVVMTNQKLCFMCTLYESLYLEIYGTKTPYNVYGTVKYEERRSPGVFPSGVYVEITFTTVFGGPGYWLTAT